MVTGLAVGLVMGNLGVTGAAVAVAHGSSSWGGETVVGQFFLKNRRLCESNRPAWECRLPRGLGSRQEEPCGLAQ
jgi:hypothetical protein